MESQKERERIRQRNTLKDNNPKISKLHKPHQSTDQAQRAPSRTNTKNLPKHTIFHIPTAKNLR